MTRVLRLLALVPLLVLALAGCQHLRLGLGPDLTAPPERGLRVATHNVHYILVNQPTGAWSVADWQARAPSLDAAFKRLDADLVAFQEMESFAGGNSDDENLARSYLLARNPGYAAAAVGDWRRFPSTQPIFYRTQRLRLLEQGWFFFSDTPDVIYSRTFDGSYPAFASWARFEDRETGARLRVLNLHTDYSSAGNRSRSIELVADRMAPWIDAGERVVQRDPGAHVGALPGAVLARVEELHGLHEVRGQRAEQQVALGESLVHQREVEHLQVAQAAVHELRGAGRGPGSPVLHLDDRRAQPARRGVEGDAGAGDASADHEHVDPGG